jgi:hypothetical protein
MYFGICTLLALEKSCEGFNSVCLGFLRSKFRIFPSIAFDFGYALKMFRYKAFNLTISRKELFPLALIDKYDSGSRMPKPAPKPPPRAPKHAKSKKAQFFGIFWAILAVFAIIVLSKINIPVANASEDGSRLPTDKPTDLPTPPKPSVTPVPIFPQNEYIELNGNSYSASTSLLELDDANLNESDLANLEHIPKFIIRLGKVTR